MSDRICSVEGCGRPHQARGWCKMHWKRWKKSGATDQRIRRTTCTIEGCDAYCRGSGLCFLHYQRRKRHGNPTVDRRRNPDPSAAWIEFLRLAALETDECIVWPFGLQGGGYGRVGIPSGPGTPRNRRELVHRLALEMRGEPRADGMEAAHAPGICHNRACMNYRHLRWATRAENVKDMLIDDTVPRGERSTSRLTTKDVRDIRNGRFKGETQRAVADRLGVCPATVHAIIHRRTWAWLD